MASQKDLDEYRKSCSGDTEVDFAGYDPYIVAITAADHAAGTPEYASPGEETLESRKAKLLTWLREHGA